MRRLALSMAAISACGLAACAGTRLPVEAPPVVGASVNADIRDRAGRTVARATATQAADGIRIRVEATAMSAGAFAAHIHAVGRCDAPDFESAGAHWNPANRQHGLQNPQGPHMGDLPNLLVGGVGQGTMEYTVPGARLTGETAPMLDGDGAALVIHARPDDHHTDPSGNSGDRIACGVFG